MATNTSLEGILDALGKCAEADFEDASLELLAAMGYPDEYGKAGESGAPEAFVQDFPADNPDTASERVFLEQVENVRIINQLTDDEVEALVSRQHMLLDMSEIDKSNARSFLFASVELVGDSYPRGQYALFTREINKRFAIPTVVVFRAASDRVTLAFVNRRVSIRDAERDVLGNVSLIREINPLKPHRAHLDILRELSLDERIKWMDSREKPHNFDGLLAAWLDALDTEELNKRFYKELFDWFERATKQAKLPPAPANFPSSESHRETHIIRLITRMLFVWFVKEKGLIAADLFNEAQVRRLLRKYDRNRGDSYYRAVLQNLFFATLNTEIDRRGFSTRAQRTHRDFSRYRYEREIADVDALMRLFEQTPFINGGLFDCLDTFVATGRGGYRIDYFSDNVIRKGTAEYGKYSISNRLFFGTDANGSNPGLIDLFDRYKFTVEENTPAEQEVALDPELLGKVFENLLAANIPETRVTARKQTGSYYTPRAVVDYMVDKALVASLSDTIQSHDGDRKYLRDRLRYLLDYADAFGDADTLFTEYEREAIVRAIAEVKVLDPAVGSGAFPMSMLHKLTLALRRLDEDNQLWEALQKEMATERAAAAFDTSDPQEREDELTEISGTFEKYRDSDFGRKLYLIQNSIYGVDIQPVATQIAKLRFFISLAIEQQPDQDADNLGIRPLPNLETRFVAANTLLGLKEANRQLTLGQTAQVNDLQRDIDANRERHFHANTRDKKNECRNEDKRLRQLLADALRDADFDASDAAKIASWDPYDQNASADWFDASYMFGVGDGFDVVIGNPPYRQVRKRTYSATLFPFSEGRDKGKQNLYKLFVEHSYNLCKDGGVATLIVQSSLMCDLSSAATRQLLLERTRLHHIIEFPKAAPTREAQLFQSVTQGTCIYQFTKLPSDNEPISISVDNDAFTIADLRFAPITKATVERLYPSLRCLPRIRPGSTGILEKIAGDDSIRPLREYASNIEQGDLNLTTHSKRFSTKPTTVRLIRGRNVGRFAVKYDSSTEYCDEGFMLDRVKANREGTFLISQEVTGTNDIRRLHFGLAEKPPTDFLCGHSVNKTQLKDPALSKAFMGLLNSKFMDWFFRITSTNNHVQGYELQQLPIPTMVGEYPIQLNKLVEDIIQAKAADPQADTSELEEEIDWLVYDLYDLSDEEVTAIADALWDGEVSEEEQDAALVRAIEAGLAEDDERYDISVAKEILSELSEGRS
ncbi:MAG: N-6 DNA methylase [Chloroflexota bacterium]|nr:N-6 DNA methylase [Chloroflexota bacterium]